MAQLFSWPFNIYDEHITARGGANGQESGKILDATPKDTYSIDWSIDPL